MKKLVLILAIFFSVTACKCQDFIWWEGGNVPCEDGYGLIYNGYDIDSIVAYGWTIPTYNDFNTLTQYIESKTPNVSVISGIYLKDTDTTYWYDLKAGTTNAYKLNIRGNGYRDADGTYVGGVKDVNNFGYFHINYLSTVYGAVFNDSEDYVRFQTWGTDAKKHGTALRAIRAATVSEQSLADGTYVQNYVGNDLKQYRAVKIGLQIWLADNLQETKFRNGDIIPFHGSNNDSTFTNAEWAALTTAGVCAYGNDLSNVGCDFEFPEE